MNLKVKYTPVLVREPESVKDFMDAMGFKFCQKVSITDEQSGIIVGRNHTDESFLFLIENTTTDVNIAGNRSNIIINTDDCLTDYHKLVDLGMKIKNAPQYTSLGLSADLVDDAGNQYTLLEERNYLDN